MDERDRGVRIVPAHEVQAIFNRADQELDEQMKLEHPEQPLSLIEEQFPDEWVAVRYTKVVPNKDAVLGRVFGHAPTRESLEEELQRDYPEFKAGCSVYFTGEYNFGSDLILA